MAVAVIAVSNDAVHGRGHDGRLGELRSAFPIFVSGPVFCFIAAKLRELAIAHHELSTIASQDSLTTVLNRGTFVALVDADLWQVNLPHEGGSGLLTIDADHFKAINDRYGHSAADS